MTEATDAFDDFDNLYLDDVDAVENGTWVNVAGKFEIKIAKWGNKQCEKIIERHRRPLTKQIRENAASPNRHTEVLEKMYRASMDDALINAVLKDWRGLMIKGQEIPYSVEKAKELMTDPARARFRDTVFQLASAEATFAAEEKADVIKN